MNLSPKQLSALRWIDRYGTLPAVEPRTWKSLVTRGLVNPGNYRHITLTDAGRKAL